MKLSATLITFLFSSFTPLILAQTQQSSSTSHLLTKRCPPFDPAGVKNIGNGNAIQFVGGQCLSNADCQQGCCANPCGICSGPGASTQNGKQGCGFGGGATGDTGTANTETVTANANTVTATATATGLGNAAVSTVTADSGNGNTGSASNKGIGSTSNTGTGTETGNDRGNNNNANSCRNNG